MHQHIDTEQTRDGVMHPSNGTRTNSISSNAAEDSSAATVNLKTWPAWVDLLSDPAHFNILLKEYGVIGLQVQEVIALDQTSLAELPRPIHALVFLFRWKLSGREDIEGDCPERVWFAQQTADNSCATTALLNIVNNIPGLSLGPQLQSFKERTLLLSPLDKGDALDSFAFVRARHNSFATAGDIRDADIRLQEAAERERREAAAESRRLAAATKRALKTLPEEANERRTSGRTNAGKRKGDGSVAGRAKKAKCDEEEAANHFCAYMPVNNQLWKLDGLEPTPEMLGDLDSSNDEAWLSRAVEILQNHMASYDDGSLAFNIMAIVQDPLVGSRKLLHENVRAVQFIEAKLTSLVEDWRQVEEDADKVAELISGISQKYDVSQSDIDEAEDSALVSQLKETEDLLGLLGLRKKAANEQQALKTHIIQETRDAKDTCEQVFFYRHDYDGFFDAWLDELGEVDALDSLLERYD